MLQVFLDDDYSDDEYEVGVSDTIKADEEFDPTAKLAVLHVMLQKMHNRLHVLPEREQRILAYHYGLGELACRTISEAAAHFYFTEKYISEIEASALATLRDGMNDGKII